MDSLVTLQRAAAGALSLSLVDIAVARGDWQADRLMMPTPAQLAAEARGAVVIYDGLEATQVSTAMDRHFDRIENMMFTRIHHLPPPGAGSAAGVEIEDDGCD